MSILARFPADHVTFGEPSTFDLSLREEDNSRHGPHGAGFVAQAE
jgi:hypothetical protein